jgi:DNA topoisomerase-1
MPREPIAQPATGEPPLVYVSDATPGIRRVQRSKGFAYRDAQGRWIRDEAQLGRIRRLAIPPAYVDVWICPLPNGHLQATGRDARGRKQYRYHPMFRQAREAKKFERILEFGRALPRIRAAVARDLAAAARKNARLTRELVLAAVVRLLDTTLVRVGNDEYARSNASFGLTTLRNRHAGVEGSVLRLRFRGKSGVPHEVTLDDPRVARVVRRCLHVPGQELFQWQDEQGMAHSIGSGDVNDYLEAVSGARFTAKDFRTWHASARAFEAVRRMTCEGLDQRGAGVMVRQMLAEVAQQMRNTPAVCRAAYVHPSVLALCKAAREAQAICRRIGDAPRGARGLPAQELRLLRFLDLERRASARPASRAQRAGSLCPART